MLLTQQGVNSGFPSDDKTLLLNRQQTCGNLHYLYVYVIFCVHVLILNKYVHIISAHNSDRYLGLHHLILIGT